MNTALKLAPTNDTVIIVGEEYLLVLLIGLCKTANVLFLKPGKNKVSSVTFSPTDAISDILIADNILFLHAMGGCDTTSALYNEGKLKFLHTLRRNPYLADSIKLFKESNATQNMIADAVENSVIAQSFDIYVCYNKSAFKLKANIASLPPSAAAVRQHSLLLGSAMVGWRKKPGRVGMEKLKNWSCPVASLLPPAPPDLLKLVSSKCTTNFQRSCDCKLQYLVLELRKRAMNELELDFSVTEPMKEDEEIIQDDDKKPVPSMRNELELDFLITEPMNEDEKILEVSVVTENK
ncbi:unnamed protein product [Ceutorhynchus assimilis]|uniref:Uncharacterized protein n=1 Tax=Ceutorhynchus assimilis TaxID=467358 RepID=A0A9N9MF34_9CUCU|nr:unnamed protein product [Ceutorhynchus assimilis]